MDCVNHTAKSRDELFIIEMGILRAAEKWRFVLCVIEQ